MGNSLVISAITVFKLFQIVSNISCLIEFPFLIISCSLTCRFISNILCRNACLTLGILLFCIFVIKFLFLLLMETKKSDSLSYLPRSECHVARFPRFPFSVYKGVRSRYTSSSANINVFPPFHVAVLFPIVRFSDNIPGAFLLTYLAIIASHP